MTKNGENCVSSCEQLKVFPLVRHIATHPARSGELFSVRLARSEKQAFEFELKTNHIRALLYFKALNGSATTFESVAADLMMSKSDVIAATQKLRQVGFIKSASSFEAQSLFPV